MLVLLAMLGGCADRRFEFTRVAMGVEARVVVYARSFDDAAAGANAAYERIEEVESALSDYRTSGEVARVLASPAGTWVEVTEDFEHVLRRAIEIARASDGSFDPTVGPLVRLWREARRTGRLPERVAIMEARSRVGFEAIEVGESRVRLAREGVSLDFGGIGKGYGAHEGLEALRARGLGRAMVALAGDVALGDPPPGARGWTVVADRDLGEGGDDLVLARACVSTSGDAFQFVEIEGVRYSHIVSPRTGIGLTRRIAATVVADRGEDADALASALCVAGPEHAAEVLGVAPGAAAIVAWLDEPTGEIRRVEIDPARRLRRAARRPRDAGR